jgi:hypothetical protein
MFTAVVTPIGKKDNQSEHVVNYWKNNFSIKLGLDFKVLLPYSTQGQDETSWK